MPWRIRCKHTNWTIGYHSIYQIKYNISTPINYVPGSIGDHATSKCVQACTAHVTTPPQPRIHRSIPGFPVNSTPKITNRTVSRGIGGDLWPRNPCSNRPTRRLLDIYAITLGGPLLRIGLTANCDITDETWPVIYTCACVEVRCTIGGQRSSCHEGHCADVTERVIWRRHFACNHRIRAVHLLDISCVKWTSTHNIAHTHTFAHSHTSTLQQLHIHIITNSHTRTPAYLHNHTLADTHTSTHLPHEYSHTNSFVSKNTHLHTHTSTQVPH